MAVTRVLVLVAVVALCIESVLSCMCKPQHPQTDFCDSEFVLRGKILTRTPVYGGFNPDMPMKIVYNVQVNTVYRTLGSNIDIKEDDEVNITTPGYESMCGVTNMTVDERYLITAKEIGGKLITNLCKWNALFTQVTSSQKKMLRNDFKQECSLTPPCEVRKYCGAPDPSQCQQFDGCTFYQQEDCYTQHSYCTRRNGQCQWRRYAKRYNECLAAQSRKR
ncbi:metalloproteinase inhibitor 3-like [Apostichopus japonicus]|uniref:metalloproteinase inhibitor 3-like n=1 Tax=Stichopus japonicus TaxID=307972 RepID=UPI003AB85DD9